MNSAELRDGRLAPSRQGANALLTSVATRCLDRVTNSRCHRPSRSQVSQLVWRSNSSMISDRVVSSSRESSDSNVVVSRRRRRVGAEFLREERCGRCRL